MENENMWIVILIAVLAIFSFSGFSGFGMMGGFRFGSMWIFGFLFMTLILVALVLAIFSLVNQLRSNKK